MNIRKMPSSMQMSTPTPLSVKKTEKQAGQINPEKSIQKQSSSENTKQKGPVTPPSFKFDAPAVAFPSPSSLVSEKEIDWAMKLESKVKEGYQPTAKETKKYKGVAQRLQEQMQTKPSVETQKKMMPPPPPTPVIDSDANWAMTLESKVKEGYKPSPEETLKYEGIIKHLQENPSNIITHSQMD